MSENKGRNDANSGNLLMQKLSLADSCFSSERILSRAKFGSTRNLSYPILFTCCMSIMPFTARTTDMLPSISGRQAAFLPANRLATFSDDQVSAFLEILLQNLIPSKESSWLVALTSIAIKLEQSKFFWIHMHHIGRLKLDSIRESHLVILDDQNLLGLCFCTGTGHAHLARRFLVAKIGYKKTIPHTRVPAGTLVETLEAVNFLNHGSSEKTSKFFKKSLKCSVESSSFTVAK